MRIFRITCGTASILLVAFLLFLDHAGAVSISVHVWLLGGLIGNIVAWIVLDRRCAQRCHRVDRRMSTALAANDVAQIQQAITNYRTQPKEKGDNE